MLRSNSEREVYLGRRVQVGSCAMDKPLLRVDGTVQPSLASRLRRAGCSR